MNRSASVAFLAVFALVYYSTVALPNSNVSFPIMVDGLSLSSEKKSAKNKINTGSTVKRSPSKGFGRRETLDDLLRTYPTRRPEKTNNKQPCPCGVEEINYGDCCYPYHMKMKLPESPKRVLQSRYSAFVYRIIGYIIDTTHPSCRDYREDKISWAKDLNKNGMFDSVDFVSLNITKCGDIEKISRYEDFIEFRVILRAQMPTREDLPSSSSSDECGSDVRIKERSKFILNNTTGGWLYASGVVRSSGNGMDELILNP